MAHRRSFKKAAIFNMSAMYFWIDGPSIPTFPFDVVLTLFDKLPTYLIIYARDPLAQIPGNLLSEFTFS
jgi:hypothetical protein